MGDALKSLLSVHSVQVQSRLSVLSNSKLSSSTTPNANPHSTTSNPGHNSNKVKQTGKPTSSSTAKATHTPQAGKGGGGGISGGAIAAIVIIILLAAAGAGFLFWRRRRQQNTRTRSGLWLESRSVYEAYSKPAGDTASSGHSGYIFNGSGRNGVSGEPRPLSVAPPPPPAKEKPYEPSNVKAASLSRDPPLPSPVHAPRPRTPEPPSANPYTQVQEMLAHSHHPRPDSGPMILYSTPRQDDYYEAQPNVLQLPAVSTQSVVGASASSFPEPNTPTSLKHAPPMPVPVPEPVPVPPSPTTPITPQNRAPSIQSRVSSPALPAFQTAPSSPAVPPMPSTVVTSNDNRNIQFVIRTYVPTMLDELRVSVGERVVVVNKFDDGWAYCEKVDDPDGAAGVIPLECLDNSSSLSPPSTTSPAPSLTSSDPRLSNTRFSSFHVDFDPANANRV